MKKLMLVSLGLLAASTAAYADTADLAKAKECLSCHSIDKEGAKAPSFKAIATKYKGVKNADIALTQTVKNGGVGHWGNAPMPAGGRPTVTDAEAKELVAWVLSQK
jgi:cytochrome c